MITDQNILSGKICPYCLKPSQLVDSSVIYGTSYGNIYLCRPCDAYVGTHKYGHTIALGRLANSELRKWKKEAHLYFDRIWKTYRLMNRNQAYKWLSQQLGLQPQYTHIGMFDIEECKRVVEACKNKLGIKQ